METIPLRDAIRALRVEIIEAVEDASSQAVLFEVGPIEMEFQVVAKKEKGSDAKIDFHIFGAGVTVGGSGKGADERTQKVKLMLTPVFVDDDGKRRKVDISRSSESEKQQSQKFTLDRP